MRPVKPKKPIVDSAYRGRDNRWRVYLTDGSAKSYVADEELPYGTEVTIDGDHVRRARG